MSFNNEKQNSSNVNLGEIASNIFSIMSKIADNERESKQKRKRIRIEETETETETFSENEGSGVIVKIDYNEVLTSLKYSFIEFDLHHKDKKLREHCINQLFMEIITNLKKHVEGNGLN